MRTTIFFRLVHSDAKKFGGTIGRYSSDDLLDLDRLEAIIRSGKASNAKKFRITFPPKPPKGFRDEIIAHTKASYPPIHRPMEPVLATDDDEVSYGDPLPPA